MANLECVAPIGCKCISSYNFERELVGVPFVKCYHICIVFLVSPGQGKEIFGFAVGPEQEFYVETDSGFKGGKLNGGFLLWCDSLAHNRPATNIDAAIHEFEDGRELG